MKIAFFNNFNHKILKIVMW